MRDLGKQIENIVKLKHFDYGHYRTSDSRCAGAQRVRRQAGGKLLCGGERQLQGEEWREVTQTEFFDCSYWIGTGIAQYLTKGAIVELSGRVSARAWVDSEGQAKAGLNFHTSKITLHGGGAATDKQQAKQPAKAEPAAMEVTGTQVNTDSDKDDLPF